MMEGYKITIDTGTTNTRVVLWDSACSVRGMVRAAVGVRDTAITGSNQALKTGIKEALKTLLEEAGVSSEGVEAVFASGMLASEVGLLELPHIPAPAGILELAAATRPFLLPDVFPRPIFFIPGVKNSVEPLTEENLEAMDFMRGEEVEALALLALLPQQQPVLLVLPGSHTKFVAVNAGGKITGSVTAITGELLSAITHNTILADAVEHQFVSDETYRREWLFKGYRATEAVGLGRACFSGRVLRLLLSATPGEVANYVLGAVLHSDLLALKNTTALGVQSHQKIIVAGAGPMTRALVELLREFHRCPEVLQYTPEEERPLAAYGALLVGDHVG